MLQLLSIVWEGCVPKFVDIDPKTLNVDILSIEKSIDNNTRAILVTLFWKSM